MRKRLPLWPTRSWRKKSGPGEVRCIRIAPTRAQATSSGSAATQKPISIARFQRGSPEPREQVDDFSMLVGWSENFIQGYGVQRRRPWRSGRWRGPSAPTEQSEGNMPRTQRRSRMTPCWLADVQRDVVLKTPTGAAYPCVVWLRSITPASSVWGPRPEPIYFS